MSSESQNGSRADRFSRHPRQGVTDATSNGSRRAKAQRRGAQVPGPVATGSDVARAAAVPSSAVGGAAPAGQPRGAASADEWVCHFCLESGGKRPANVWCATCLRYMCPSCNRHHCVFSRGHFVITLEEFKAWDDGRCASEPMCPTHGQSLELLCLTCCKCQCVECRSHCDAQRHDVRPISDPSIDGFVKKLRDDALSVQHQHDDGCCAGRSVVHKRQAVRATRDRLCLRIRQHRLAVVNALDLAHATAEKELWELLSTALGTKSAAGTAAASASEQGPPTASAKGSSTAPRAASASEPNPAAGASDGSSTSAAKCCVAQHSSGACRRSDKCRGGGNYRTAVAAVDSVVEEQRLLLQQLESLLNAMDAARVAS